MFLGECLVESFGETLVDRGDLVWIGIELGSSRCVGMRIERKMEPERMPLNGGRKSWSSRG